ncbi:MAG: LytTR family DNA-binding domain-containing protein [Chitinophagaceae bacterium]|nr:LytTR family DNA-binding domain-containing protein [Chitinophagaceae bacterium]
MIKVLIIDDEQYCIDSLIAKLKPYSGEIEVVAAISKVLEMPGAVAKFKPQVLFLDINLGPFTGFDLIEKLNPPLPKIVFTTAYDHFAIKAFKFNAVDYLLKPVDADELEQTIQKLRKIESPWPDLFQIKQTITQLRDKATGLKKLALPTLQGFELIELEELIRLEAASNYTHFYLSGGKKMTISKTLKEYEDLLEEDGFARIHQSHIINLRFLKSFNKGKTATIAMQDGALLDVGNTRREAFMEKFREYFKVG